jgi:hypothetical protein
MYLDVIEVSLSNDRFSSIGILERVRSECVSGSPSYDDTCDGPQYKLSDISNHFFAIFCCQISATYQSSKRCPVIHAHFCLLHQSHAQSGGHRHGS